MKKTFRSNRVIFCRIKIAETSATIIPLPSSMLVHTLEENKVYLYGTNARYHFLLRKINC